VIDARRSRTHRSLNILLERRAHCERAATASYDVRIYTICHQAAAARLEVPQRILPPRRSPLGGPWPDAAISGVARPHSGHKRMERRSLSNHRPCIFSPYWHRCTTRCGLVGLVRLGAQSADRAENNRCARAARARPARYRERPFVFVSRHGEWITSDACHGHQNEAAARPSCGNATWYQLPSRLGEGKGDGR
jgi:hypothetical protein